MLRRITDVIFNPSKEVFLLSFVWSLTMFDVQNTCPTILKCFYFPKIVWSTWINFITFCTAYVYTLRLLFDVVDHEETDMFEMFQHFIYFLQHFFYFLIYFGRTMSLLIYAKQKVPSQMSLKAVVCFPTIYQNIYHKRIYIYIYI